MESKPETVLNPEDELKRLREKTGQQELTELKRGLMGGYKQKDVAAYVERLKNQLATAERTYKARISELSQEKDQLRFERDGLQSRLKQLESEPASDELKSELHQARQVAESFLADRGSLEEKLKYMTRMSDEAVAALQQRVEELEAGLALAGERNEALVYEADAAREEQREAFEKELAALAAEREGLQVQLEALAARAEQTEAGLRGELQEMIAQLEAAQARAADADMKVEEATHQLGFLSQENAVLTSQVETARQNISALMQDNQTVEAVNDRMRAAINSLLVKAEAVVKENGVVAALLEAEREKVRRYQLQNSGLADMVARVRTAGQLLGERVEELDRTLAGQEGQATGPEPVSARVKGDPLDFTPARNPLKDIVAELAVIQAGMAQYQKPQQSIDHRPAKPAAAHPEAAGASLSPAAEQSSHAGEPLREDPIASEGPAL